MQLKLNAKLNSYSKVHRTGEGIQHNTLGGRDVYSTHPASSISAEGSENLQEKLNSMDTVDYSNTQAIQQNIQAIASNAEAIRQNADAIITTQQGLANEATIRQNTDSSLSQSIDNAFTAINKNIQDIGTNSREIILLNNKVNSLEGQTVRLLYSGTVDDNHPTAMDIQDFVVSQGYDVPNRWSTIAVVIPETYHVWRCNQTLAKEVAIPQGSNLREVSSLIQTNSQTITFNANTAYAITFKEVPDNSSTGMSVGTQGQITANITYTDNSSDSVIFYDTTYNPNFEWFLETYRGNTSVDSSKTISSITCTPTDSDAFPNTIIWNAGKAYIDYFTWQDDGVDTITTFTNNAPGIIQGKQDSNTNFGYITAINGFGKIIGIDGLITNEQINALFIE